MTDRYLAIPEKRFRVRRGYSINYLFTAQEGEILINPPEGLIRDNMHKLEPVNDNGNYAPDPGASNIDDFLAEVLRNGKALTISANTEAPHLPPVDLPYSSPSESSQVLRDGAWQGRRCFIIGGGPSLKGFDFSQLEGELVVGVNRAYEQIDPAVIFSIDSRFYFWVMTGKFGDAAKEKYQRSLAAKFWLNVPGFRCGPDIISVPVVPGTSPGTVKKVGRNSTEGVPHFGNSGLAALNLAIILGANPIYLLGFDMDTQGKFQKWWHDGYPVTQRDDVYKTFRLEFEMVAPDIERLGVQVINLNPDSGVRCFGFGKFPGPLPQAPLFVSCYTPGLYADKAARLRRSLHFLGLEYQIEEVEDLGSWDANTRHKATFIQRMLRDHRGRDLVWVDADATVQRHPTHFTKFGGDLGVHFKDGQELLSGTIYLKNNRRVRGLVDAWVQANQEDPHTWEQKILARVLKGTAGKGVRLMDLPPTYCQIFDSMAGAGVPVIEHFQASRQLRGQVANA